MQRLRLVKKKLQKIDAMEGKDAASLDTGQLALLQNKPTLKILNDELTQILTAFETVDQADAPPAEVRRWQAVRLMSWPDAYTEKRFSRRKRRRRRRARRARREESQTRRLPTTSSQIRRKRANVPSPNRSTSALAL